MPVATANAADTPALIELDRASVMRGERRVLHELSLRIELGQHTAILGANGCGKSSLIKLITRELYPLTHADGASAVKVLGHSRWQVERLRSQLGIVSADLSANLADMPGLDVESAVLSGFFASYVVPPQHEVSAAMRARVAEALTQVRRALINRPRALLLDEPSTGLDLVARQHLLASLGELAERGITLVLVTHHIEEIVAQITRVILLREGRIYADGSCQQLLTDTTLSAVFGGQVRVHHDAHGYSAYPRLC
jgi:iron complex transport system ATP-binding protein